MMEQSSIWQRVRLKYLATINDEVLSEDTDPLLEIQYIDIGNVYAGGNIDEPDLMLFGEAPSRARRIVRDGDIIVSTVRTYLQAIAPINNPPENLVVSTGFAVLRANQKRLHPNYCKYCVKAAPFLAEVAMKSVGVSYPAINASDLGNIFIDLPPMPIQEALSVYLDKEVHRMETLIRFKGQMLRLLEKQWQAITTLVVTRGLNRESALQDSGVEWLGTVPKHWELKRLKFLTSKIGSGITPKGGAAVYENEGIPFLRSQNIQFDGLQIENLAYISEDIHAEMSNSKVEAGDVLMNITGASIGRCCMYDGQLGEANVNQHVCVLRPNKKILPEYLAFFLSTEKGQIQVDLEQTGSGREGLNFESLKSFMLPLPPLTEQLQIVTYIQKENARIDTFKKITEHSIELLKERRSVLITHAVTGKLNDAYSKN